MATRKGKEIVYRIVPDTKIVEVTRDQLEDILENAIGDGYFDYDDGSGEISQSNFRLEEVREEK